MLDILFQVLSLNTPIHYRLDNVEIIIHKPRSELYGGTSGKLPLPGISLIKRFESFFPYAYPDPRTHGKPITIGWGSTKKQDGSAWHLGDRITRKQADKLLIYQLEHTYLPELQQIPGWEKMSARQQGALLSFSYNLGEKFYKDRNFRSLQRVLNYRDWKHLKDVLVLYRNPGSNVEAGLRIRRLTEAYIFFQNDDD